MTTQTSAPVRSGYDLRPSAGWLKKAAWLAGLALLIWLAREPLAAFMSLMDDRQRLLGILDGFGPLAPAMLFFLVCLQVFVGFIPGHVLMFASGYLYGPFWGSLLTVSATTASAQLAFLIARRAGRPLIYRLAGREVVQKWERLSGRKEVLFYFFSFILPIFPSDLMSYVAGLGTISPRQFLVANLAARVPVGVFLTLLGVYTFRLPIGLWIITGVFLALAGIGYVLYAARVKS